MSAIPPTLINGQRLNTISVSDRGFQYGDGVFRTLLVSSGSPVYLARQLEKLRSDARALDICPPDDELWMSDIKQLLSDYSGSAALKLMLTRGISARGYKPEPNAPVTRVVTLSRLPDYPDAFWQEGVHIALCETRWGHQPALAGIKHLNRLEQVLARKELADRDTEGLMCDIEGNVISGTMSNLFIVQNEEIITPSLDLCGVAGCMREKILELALNNNLTIRIDNVNLDDINRAGEIFLCNSLFGIWPVSRFREVVWRPGPATRLFQRQLKHPLIPLQT